MTLLLLLIVSFARADLLWDNWYTVTTTGDTHYSYFNEKVEKKEGRVHVTQEIWKKEEGHTNRENLGAVAMDDEALRPLFFNFRRVYRLTEIQADGTVDEKSLLTVKIKAATEGKSAKQFLGKGTFLSAHFPVWLGKNLNSPTPKKSFRTVFEDGMDQNFKTVFGRLAPLPDDEFAKKTKTKKIQITLDDRKMIWWVHPNGAAEKIEVPGKQVVERTDKFKAIRFLE